MGREGVIVEENIKMIEEIYSNIKIDEYLVMPNHIHIILLINKKRDTTISRVIKQYKESITKFQKLFYEHIIRNEKEYLKINIYKIIL